MEFLRYLFLLRFLLHFSIKALDTIQYFDTYMAVAIQDDLLQMLEVRVVYEGSQIGAVGRRN